MRRLFCFFIVFSLLLFSMMPAYAQGNQIEEAKTPVFITPEGNIFFPKTPEQIQMLDRFMRLYEEGNIEEARRLEEIMLADPNFESRAKQ